MEIKWRQRAGRFWLESMMGMLESGWRSCACVRLNLMLLICIIPPHSPRKHFGAEVTVSRPA